MKIPVLHQVRKVAARFFELAEEGRFLTERPEANRNPRCDCSQNDEYNS